MVYSNQTMIIPTELLAKLDSMKSERTYEQLSKDLDVPVPTLYRWRSKGRMNRFYVKALTASLLKK